MDDAILIGLVTLSILALIFVVVVTFIYSGNIGGVRRNEIGQLREKLAAAYVELSGSKNHTSDCATSNSPAMTPEKCDCDQLK